MTGILEPPQNQPLPRIHTNANKCDFDVLFVFIRVHSWLISPRLQTTLREAR
jgi:hypothetical protein